MKPEKNGEKEKSFEENLERLETIVRELELGTLSLEDALRRFEEGVRLYRLCEERLKDAEQRVEILLKQADGTVVEAPFEAESEEVTGEEDEVAEMDAPSGTGSGEGTAPGIPGVQESRTSSGKGRSGRRAQSTTPGLIPDDDPAGELPF